MFDRAARRAVDPLVDRLADRCVARGLSANAVTAIGFGFGLLAMLLVALRHDLLGLLALAVNRTADGVDGAVARRTGATELGGYLDIVCDFLVYAGIPLAFALGRPEQALPAAFLIFSFVGTGTTFLAFAIFTARPGENGARSQGKSFHYLGGLTEGSETIACFVIVLLFPGLFAPAAWLFGALCWITTAGRILAAVTALR
jgi:phosphatidylglycerophosphate synthase